eukprot:SAG22_NODE_11009_length_505_cov_0.891626_1_plen_60_part_10
MYIQLYINLAVRENLHLKSRLGLGTSAHWAWHALRHHDAAITGCAESLPISTGMAAMPAR